MVAAGRAVSRLLLRRTAPAVAVAAAPPPPRYRRAACPLALGTKRSGTSGRGLRDCHTRPASAVSGARAAVTAAKAMKFIDIGANLLDGMYSGQYNGKEYHPPDLSNVLSRAWQAGMDRMIITAGNLQEAKDALALAKTDDRLFCTVGVHPTRCGELEEHPEGPEAYISALMEVIREGKELGKVVAVGECGLDYDRLHFCEKEPQRKGFARQLQMAAEVDLPLFLHLRAAADDFVDICSQHNSTIAKLGGVVHSFDGSQNELSAVLSFPHLCIGINGCSLKTEENLDVMAAVPAARLMLETDCPWCDIRPSHAGKKYVTTILEAKDKKKHSEELLVKGRNEPCNIRQVFEVVARHRGVEDERSFAEEIYTTTAQMFFASRAC